MKWSETVFEAKLEKTLGTEACFGIHSPSAREVDLGANRNYLEGTVGLGVVVGVAGLHVAEFNAEADPSSLYSSPPY